MRRDGRYVTVGASDSIAQRIDDMERTAGDGPCVDAIEEETPQIETDLTTPNQWPQLAARLVAETPVRGAMGFRILVDKRKTGALNLFSDKADVFDTESAGQAIVLASFASVAINAVAQGEDVSTLRRGLLSNREIGKAVGMLMMLNGVDEQDGVRHPAPVFPGSEHQARRRGAVSHREAAASRYSVTTGRRATASVGRRAYSGSRSSGFSTSSMLTSLKVTTRTCLTNRAGRYMSHTHASDSRSSK